MSWILNLATELISASAVISIITAISGFLFSKNRKNKIVITAGANKIVMTTAEGKKSEYSGVSSEEMRKIIQELNQELNDEKRKPTA